MDSRLTYQCAPLAPLFTNIKINYLTNESVIHYGITTHLFQGSIRPRRTT